MRHDRRASSVIGPPTSNTIGPERSRRFDIAATAPQGTSPANVKLMLQDLLADRFKLVIRRETRDRPIYALVAARSDKRLGPKLTRSSIENCAPARASARPCNMNMNSGRVRATGTQLSELAPLLSQPAYLRTLEAYLDHDLDVGRAARALHLHPNSLRYRLSRVEAVLGRSLRDLPTVVDLFLATATARESLGAHVGSRANHPEEE